jgi:hypothetical protein
MKRVVLSLFLCGLMVSAATAQEGLFDVEAYKAFLAAHTGIDADGLRALHDAGSFAERVTARFDEARYSDSISVRFDLTNDERDLLDRHGFMVTERLAPNSFADAYWDIYKKDMPVFLSTDAILHALHMSYDLLLQDIERDVLIPRLEALLADLHAALPALEARYAAEPRVLASLRDVDVYLTVPRTLLAGTSVAPHWPDNQAVVSELLAFVAAEDLATYPLFAETCRYLDFSQFTPRGHYTEDPALTRYFQAMMWLGRTEIYLIAPETDECKPTDADVQRQTLDAVLLAEALDASHSEALLQEIDGLIGFFVGEPDNVTVDNLRGVMETAQVAQASDLVDEERWRAFQDVLAEESFAFQRINSQILFSQSIYSPDELRPAAAFLLLGQRFVIDSYATGHVVFKEVVPVPPAPPRMLPSTQDVLFALGNDASAQLLQPELERYGYAPNLAALRYLVDSYEPDFWNSTLYNGWLDAIRTLNPPAARADLPAFMQTGAWWQQKMNTQLAAWAQLRHDNLLYAKQSYSGGITCMFPFSYVEPFPAFYEAVSRFARNAAAHFEAIDGAGTSVAGYAAQHFRFMEGINDTLTVIAQKERDRVPFDDEEKEFLRRMLREHNTCGPEIDGWYPRLFYGGKERSLEPDLVVADVHTAPTDESGAFVGWVLHAGTGPLNMAVVNVDVPGEGRIAFIGPVMSYYEHVSTNFERLTDEAWQTAYAAAPSFRPDFVNLYLADREGASRGDGARLAMQGAAVGTGVADEAEVPPALTLAPSYPNPFREFTIIGFTVPTAQAYDRVDLDVYDVQGRRIRHLLSGDLPPGNYTVRWDGHLDNGGQAASGVYFSRLRLGSRMATGTMTLVR